MKCISFFKKMAAALVIAAISLTGCKEDDPVKVSGVSLNKTTLTLTEGKSEALTATVAPADAENKKVSWKSDKTDIATVDANGTVTAVKAGEAVITVTTEDGGKTATCRVTISAEDNGNAAVVVRAYDNKGLAPKQSLSPARAVGGEGGPVFAPGEAENNFKTYTDFYTGLGNGVAGITPTKFVMALNGISFYTPTGESMRFGGGLYDFAKDVSINVGEIPTDVTCAVMGISLTTAVTGAGHAHVEFEWPAGKTAFDMQNEQNKMYYGMSIAAGTDMPAFNPSWDGNSITMLLGNVFPNDQMNEWFDLSGPAPNFLADIYYGKGPRRFYNSGGVPVNTLIEGLNSIGGSTEIGISGDHATIVIPFDPITVPSTVSSVTFELSWNLNDIIHQYDNNTSGDPTDDIFVLRNGWWNDLRINASVQ